MRCYAGDTLIESELFGHDRGAYTDAKDKKSGKFALANTGTLLLDEVTELSLSAQAKLLRTLGEGEIEILGGKTQRVNVRVIASTNSDLRQAIKINRFRGDLYHRLNVYQIKVPPLRERTDEIPILAQHFIKKYSIIENLYIELSPIAINFLKEYNWPGNVRELENLIRAAIVDNGSNDAKKPAVINDDYFYGKLVSDGGYSNMMIPETTSNVFAVPLKLQTEKLEITRIQAALENTHGKPRDTARLLGLSHQGLINKFRRYGINPADYELKKL